MKLFTKRRNKMLILLILFILIIHKVNISQAYFAEANSSYTYDYWGEAEPGPKVFRVKTVIRGEDLGIDSLKNPQDLYINSNNEIYLLDSGNNRLICFNKDLKVKKIIDRFKNKGQDNFFNNPTGVFVTEEKIYVADKDNHRIVILNKDGTLFKIVGAPQTDIEGIIPENFSYLPRKVITDKAGRIYVIAQGVYDGLMEFDEENKFHGFIGAPRVAPNLIDYFWRKISTKEQKKRMSLILPTEFSNLAIDSKGFIYTTVSSGAIQKEEAVMRLNPGGKDVLRRNGFYPPIGDIDYLDPELDLKASIKGPSTFTDITILDNGVYHVLDQKRGRIFAYDDTGNLLYVFGELGNRIGQFKNPVALDFLGENLFVLDSGTNQVTVFRSTDYSKNILAAISFYQSGKYELSAEMWEKVLKNNTNFSLAYSGIGRSLIRQGDYRQAMARYRIANDRDGYSKAFSLYRQEYVSEHFGSIMTKLLILIALIYLISRYKLWKKLKAYISNSIKNKNNYLYKFGSSLRYSLYVIFHPFDGFWDLKHEKRGSVSAASTILLLVTLTYIYMRQYTGFIYNTSDINELNIYMEFFSIVFPFMLWCVVNWALTTLVQGKGTFRDIYIYTAYALTPLIVVNIPLTIISNYLTKEGGSFYYFFLALALLWAFLLVFLGTMVTHSFDFKKTFFVTIFILIGIAVVLFIFLLFFSVIIEVLEFFDNLKTELFYRL